MKQTKFYFLIILLIFSITACSASTTQSSSEESNNSTSITEPGTELNSETIEGENETAVIDSSIEYDSEDLETSYNSSQVNSIILDGNQISFDGTGAAVQNNSITISSAGDYLVSGTLTDGEIIVDSADKAAVRLILNGADITSLTSAPIYVRNAEKTVITLVENTQNVVTDGTNYTYDVAEEPNAAIFSNDDLTINGTGSLLVNANFNDGIASDDDLKIINGSITIQAVDDAVQGKDSLIIKDGEITITAGGDGLKSNNDSDDGKGNIIIENGVFSITSDGDAIQAYRALLIYNGDFTILTGGGSANAVRTGGWDDWDRQMNPNQGSAQTGTDSVSAKGLKADLEVFLYGGSFVIDTVDDAIHSNTTIEINGGNYQLSSGDDGIHADADVTINSGTIAVTTSYEGLEGEQININGGSIQITASDDGINGSGGSTAENTQGRPGGDMFGAGSASLVINEGYIYVNAGGDGIDINGTIEMNDGTVIVNGPTESMNGALDYMGSFNINGGLLVAVGSIGMAEAPSQTSTQYAVMYNFSGMQTAGTPIHIETQSGQEILTFTAAKEFQSLVFSSPELNSSESYKIYIGGSVSGSQTDGLLTEGSYSRGTELETFTLTNIITQLGVAGGMMNGNPPGGRDGGRRP